MHKKILFIHFKHVLYAKMTCKRNISKRGTVRDLNRAALNRASIPNLYSTLPPPCAILNLISTRPKH